MNSRPKNEALYRAIIGVLERHFGRMPRSSEKGPEQSPDAPEHVKPTIGSAQDLRHPKAPDPRYPPRVLRKEVEPQPASPAEGVVPDRKPRDPRYPPRQRYIPKTGPRCPKCAGKAPRDANGRPVCRRCGPFPIRKSSDE
jgi:hypothetical protein